MPPILPQKLRLSQPTGFGRGHGLPVPGLEWNPGMLWEEAKVLPGLSCPQCPLGAGHEETLTKPKFGVNVHITAFKNVRS